jgi:hypothetical protein
MMQPSVSSFAIPVKGMLVKKSIGLFLIFAAGFYWTSIFALEVTETAGAAHGYPRLCDINGKKLADGEFRQWVENHHLYVVITYKFPDGELREEKARFRQHPQLIQEQWSWKELKDGTPQREFAADFLSGIASAHIRKNNKGCIRKDQHRRGADIRRIRFYYRFE